MAPVSAQQAAAPETSATPPDARPDAPEVSPSEDDIASPEPEPVAQDEETTKAEVPPLIEETAEELAACKALLSAAGAVFAPVEALSDDDDPACGIVNPVRLSRITRQVRIEPPAELRCAAALALANWVTETVVPAAGHLSERGKLTALEQGSSYICRPRNNVAGARLSEHALGTAVDIMAFRFADGASVAVEPREREGSMAEAFQRAVRAGACLHFTTVLGPGTDASHANHLHLDIKARDGGFRLCQ